MSNVHDNLRVHNADVASKVMPTRSRDSAAGPAVVQFGHCALPAYQPRLCKMERTACLIIPSATAVAALEQIPFCQSREIGCLGFLPGLILAKLCCE